ncbi:MAG TPA: hypothetical protein VHD83_10375 [Puia sp.]|nr:hypothetical protein [Puia sp.]
MKKLPVLFLLAFIACRKNPTPPPSSDPAHGYFPTEKNGQCSSGIVHGVWYNGRPAGSDTNYVDVSVYVTHPGSYKIFTDTVDGVNFTGTGNFPDTGMAVARLKAMGSFKAAGNLTVPIHFDSSTCQLYVNVMDSAGIGLAANTWTFTAGGHVYSGPFTLGIYDMPQSADYNFDLEGTVAGSADTAFVINLVYDHTSTPIDTGHYVTSDRSIDQVALFVTNPGVGGVVKMLYSTNTSIGAVIDMHVLSKVELIDPGYHVVAVATFSGSMVDTAGHVAPITNAKLKWDAE